MEHDNILNLPIKKVPGVTSINVVPLENRLKIHTLGELVMLLPRSYEDLTRVYTIPETSMGSKVCIQFTVQRKVIKFTANHKMILTVTGRDSSGVSVIASFFNQARWFEEKLVENNTYYFYGVIGFMQLQSATGYNPNHGIFTISHPEILNPATFEENSSKQVLTPIYPSTDKLRAKQLHKIMQSALELFAQAKVPDLIPDIGYPIITRDQGQNLQYVDINHLSFKDSIINIHNPPIGINIRDIQNRNSPWILRLICEELLATQLGMLDIKKRHQDLSTVVIVNEKSFIQDFYSLLPFKLTSDQLKAIEDIKADLSSGKPMIRLVQGDVGSGKTMVALYALAATAKAGLQAALIAPTEILALQLYEEAKNLLSKLNINICFVSGRLKTRERREVKEKIKSGQAQVIVGTHAAYSDWVEYNNLALVIIDEQHRFGVAQRLALAEKQQAYQPHILMMTATPAPRSLAMSLYADMDVSLIAEKPPGRKPITTFMLSTDRKGELIARIRQNILQKQCQVYWVCVLVEDNENYVAESATSTLEILQQCIPEARVGLIHGKMKDQEKEFVMQQFKNHELDILVATTVIEVGVNVPNASIMIIENPERLGLSQIHQLRGRVGRGSKASSCGLLYGTEIGQNQIDRLKIMRDNDNGFEIAEEDMKLRGTGELFGTKQSGEIEFLLADLQRDKEIAEVIAPFARRVYYLQPDLARQIINRWLFAKQRYSLA